MDLLVLSFFLAKIVYINIDNRFQESIFFWILMTIVFYGTYWFVRKDCKLKISKAYFYNNIFLYYLFFIFRIIYFAWNTGYPLGEGDSLVELLIFPSSFLLFYIPIGLILRYYFLYKNRAKIGNRKKVFFAFISELFLFYK